MGLRRRDLERTLAFVADAHDRAAPQPLTTDLLDQLTELFGCEYASYQESDWARRTVTAYVWCSNEGPLAVPPPYVPEEWWTADAARFPRAFHRNGAAFEKLSDRFDRRERERLRREDEFNSEFLVVDRMGLRVAQTRTCSAWLGFDSQQRDFDERDRELALVLLPHVAALWRKAISRRRLTELLAILGRDGAADGRGLVLYEADGRISHATPKAQTLLCRWFGKQNGRLPPELDEWLAGADPGDRHTARRNGSVLTVDAAGEGTLTLHEQSAEEVRLTPRERQVLELVGAGLTNGEIAQTLWVAPGTVRRHLENAFAKLGVHTRTAAVARLRHPPT